MISNKRIVLTSDTISRGGKERQLFILAKALSAENEVYIITLDFDKNNYIDEYDFPRSNVIGFSEDKSVSLFNFFKTIKACDPDLILAFDNRTATWSLLIHIAIGVKFINCSLRHGIRLPNLSHYFRTAVLWLSPYVIANSLAGLVANNLKPTHRRFVIHNGNPLIGTFKPEDTDKEELRTRLFKDFNYKNRLIFISVANFVPYKDYETVLKALAGFRTQKDFLYFIIGKGPLQSTVTSSILRHGLEQNVIVLGPQSEIFDYLLASDIFLHSSRGEGISNAILEAMIAGLPVIASNVGGTSELLHPTSSRTFSFGNDQELLHILIHELEGLLTDSFDKSGMTAHLEKFSVARMLNDFNHVFESVL